MECFPSGSSASLKGKWVWPNTLSKFNRYIFKQVEIGDIIPLTASSGGRREPLTKDNIYLTERKRLT